MLHDIGAQECVALGFDGFFEQGFLALECDVAQTLIFGRERAVGGFGGGGEPAFVDASAMRAEGVEIARIELQAASRHEEGARDPAGGEAYDAFARFAGLRG